MFSRDWYLFVLPASPMEPSTCYRSPTGQQYDFCQLVCLVLCGSVLKEKKRVNKSVKWSEVSQGIFLPFSFHSKQKHLGWHSSETGNLHWGIKGDERWGKVAEKKLLLEPCFWYLSDFFPKRKERWGQGCAGWRSERGSEEGSTPQGSWHSGKQTKPGNAGSFFLVGQEWGMTSHWCDGVSRAGCLSGGEVQEDFALTCSSANLTG